MGRAQDAVQFVVRNHLPIALAVAVTLALALPSGGEAVARWKVAGSTGFSSLLIMLIFLISGLNLKEDDVRQALRSYTGLIAAIVIILGISPCLGFAFTALPWKSSPELGIGLAVFAAVPTTLSSGVALTQQAGGNAALALLITATTNIAGSVTTPAFLSATLRTAGARVDVPRMLISLAITLVAPLAVGKLLRLIPTVKGFADENKRSLTITSSLLLVLIVWQKLSVSAKSVYQLTGVEVVAVLAAGLVLHGLLLLLSWLVAVPFLRLQEREARAVFLLGSQKTLPGSAVIISFLDSSKFGALGLILVPCIIAHIEQLLIDSVFATRLSNDAMKLTGFAASLPEQTSEREQNGSEPGQKHTEVSREEDNERHDTHDGEPKSEEIDIENGNGNQ